MTGRTLWLTLGIVAISLAVTGVYASKKKQAKKSSIDLMTQAGQRTLEKKKIGRQHTASPLIIPHQDIPLRFSHKVHIKEDLTCVECHSGDVMRGPGVDKSVRAGDMSLPLEETCFNCHDVDEGAKADPPAACSTCHPGYNPEFPKGVERSETKKAKTFPKQIKFATPQLKMNHKAHIDLGVACATCHQGMGKIDLATRENSLPTMGKCLSCHDGKKRAYMKKKGKKVHAAAPKACATCHLTSGDGRVKTNLPGGHLLPAGWYFGDAHDEQWLKNHVAVAQADDTGCNNCHAPKFCVDCHNGVSKPLKIHPNNWILTHTIAARKNTPNCTSCHQSQNFCVNCHKSMGVDGDKKPGNWSGKFKFHPDGWAAFGKRGPNHHAWQAQRNIQACASCHTENTCLSCHATSGVRGGANVSPHPPGFKGARCRVMKRMNPRVCAKCHTTTSAQYNCN